MTANISGNPATSALRDYVSASNDIWRLVATLFSPAMRSVDDSSKANLDAFYKTLDDAACSVDWLAPNTRIVTEMVLSRIADNFLSYLSDLLRAVMHARPETILAEKGKVDIRQVLEAASLDDLKQEIIEERVYALSYKSVTDLAVYLKSQLCFDVFESPEDQGIAVKTIETRNIIVHNRCQVNQRFIDRAGGAKEEIGGRLSIAPSDLLRMNRYFDARALAIDNNASVKFGLARNAIVNT